MKLTTVSFIDSYGMEHSEALCFIFSANKNETISVSNYFNAEKGVLEETKSDYCSVTYSIGYWHNQRCLDRGTRTPQIYNPNTMDVNVTFELTEDYNGLSMEDAIWKNFKDSFASQIDAQIESVREVKSTNEAKTGYVKPDESETSGETVTSATAQS